MTPLEQVTDALRQPLPNRGLPMRVASYTSIDSGSAKVRVVISAEFGDPASGRDGTADRHDRPRQERQGRCSAAPA